MKVLLLCLVAVALADRDPLREVLKSPKATLTLYSQFKSQQHLRFSAGEDLMRFRLFRKSAEDIADANEDPEDGAVYGFNMFTTMTAEEKRQYLGYNGTSGAPEEAPEAAPAPSLVGTPTKLLWTDSSKGGVTPVKNQGGCGSCWTYGATGGLETRYQLLSGVLRDFAEQELLDCVFESRGWDGCEGGWIYSCYDWSAKNGGRLAATKDKPYKAHDYRCKTSNVPDGMVAAKITGYKKVSQSESAHIQALQTGSIGVAFEVTDRFFKYKAEIIKDTTCRGHANHAVTMVGYASNYLLVKNSWGGNWGDRGFVRFTRNYHNCKLYTSSYYPTLQSTGKSDSGSEAATDYTPPGDDDGDDPNPDPNPDPQPDPDCKDLHSNCSQYKSYCAANGWVDHMKKYCAKTCNYCEDGGDDCPSGTIRCPDGICKHEHMC